MSVPTLPRRESKRGGRRPSDLLLAWAFLAGMVVLLGSAPFIGGEGTSFRTGAILLGGLAVLLTVLTSGAVAFGVRAGRGGHASGLIAAVVGGALGGFFLVLWSLSILLHALGME